MIALPVEKCIQVYILDSVVVSTFNLRCLICPIGTYAGPYGRTDTLPCRSRNERVHQISGTNPTRRSLVSLMVLT